MDPYEALAWLLIILTTGAIAWLLRRAQWL